MQIRKSFAELTPGQSKRKGLRVALRPDWEDCKLNYMRDIVLNKFTQNESLKEILLSTGQDLLVELTTWHDNTWGICECNSCLYKLSKNYLGLGLMYVRGVLSGDDTVSIICHGNTTIIHICEEWDNIVNNQQWLIALDYVYKLA